MFVVGWPCFVSFLNIWDIMPLPHYICMLKQSYLLMTWIIVMGISLFVDLLDLDTFVIIYTLATYARATGKYAQCKKRSIHHSSTSALTNKYDPTTSSDGAGKTWVYVYHPVYHRVKHVNNEPCPTNCLLLSILLIDINCWIGITDFCLIIVWLVVWNIFCCSIYCECHHPNWRTHICQRAGLPPTSCCLTSNMAMENPLSMDVYS